MSNRFAIILAMLVITCSGVTKADSDNNRYEIQPKTSTIEFRVNSPIGEITAGFQDFGGSFTMLKSGKNNESTFININTESLNTNAGLVEMMLRGESFFDVENFPSMSFVGSSFNWINNKHAVLVGKMTIKNVTREVAFYVELIDSENSTADCVMMRATANIKRSEFNLLSLASVVSDNVNLYVNIDARKTNTPITVSSLN